MRRLLVTGGAGFVGSHFVHHALAAGADVEVVTLDALTYAGDLRSLADLADEPRHRFVQGDVRDADLVASLVNDADAVVNLAAESHVDRSIVGPAEFLETNVLGAGVVFDACRRAGVPRLLHVSTDEVYGPIEAPARFREEDRLAPSSPYAASKAAADLLATTYGTTYGYPVTVTRCVNTYGPRQLPEKLVPRFVTRLVDGGRVPLYGDGQQVRDWLHVTDNVAAQWRVLEDGEPGRIYNVGAGDERSNRWMAEALLVRLGLGADRIEPVADRPGHDRRYAVDDRRVRALGWRPRVPLEEGLSATVRWYVDNEAWWRPHVERLDGGGGS